MTHRAYVRDAEAARRLQHRQAVIHEQRARRLELFLLQQPRPKIRMFLRHAKRMGRIAGVKILRQRHALILDGQGFRMRVGDQHHPLAAAP